MTLSTQKCALPNLNNLPTTAMTFQRSAFNGHPGTM